MRHEIAGAPLVRGLQVEAHERVLFSPEVPCAACKVPAGAENTFLGKRLPAGGGNGAFVVRRLPGTTWIFVPGCPENAFWEAGRPPSQLLLKGPLWPLMC